MTNFYEGKTLYVNGKLLSYPIVMNFSLDKLENDHDYIQYLFPISQYSDFYPNAPILTLAQIQTFRKNKEMLAKVKTAFHKMLNFYGVHETKKEIKPVADVKFFNTRLRNLLNQPHNFQRITRILTFLMLVDLKKEAFKFGTFLCKLYTKMRSATSTSADVKKKLVATFPYWIESLGFTITGEKLNVIM